MGSARISFSSVVLPAKSENRNGNCEQRCEGKSIPKKLSLSGLRGFPSHKRARVHNHFNSECLILEQKV